jgi:hypothetical protein
LRVLLLVLLWVLLRVLLLGVLLLGVLLLMLRRIPRRRRAVSILLLGLPWAGRRQRLAVSSEQLSSRRHTTWNGRNRNESLRDTGRHRLENTVDLQLVAVGTFSISGILVATAPDLHVICMSVYFSSYCNQNHN